MQSTAAGVRHRILRSRDTFWRVEDFDGDPHAVVIALGRLVAAGELERLRRGVYWRGAKTRFGPRVPSAVEALRTVVGDREAIGAAGWYATNLLGLSTQVSPEPVVSIAGRPPTGLHGIRVVNRASRTGRRDARLNETEVTVLEALDVWESHVELDHATALDRFVEILRSPSIRVDRLVRAAPTESPAVRERLRAVLEHGGWSAEAEQVARARSHATRQRARRVIGDVS